MGGLILKIGVASLIAYFSYFIRWWAPVLIFPVAFFFIPAFGGNDSYPIRRNKLEHRRTLFLALCIAFTVVMAVLFQKRLGSWYGWLVGTILAWLDCGVIASNLEKYLRYRTPG